MIGFQFAKKRGKANSGIALSKFQATKKLLKTTTIAVSVGIAAAIVYTKQAQAVTITFDDLPGSENPIANGYAGLNWKNFYYLNTTSFTPSGYVNGTVSPENVAYNSFEKTVAISTVDNIFDFDSTYLTAAWNDNLTVLVEGFIGGESGQKKYSQTIVLNTQAPTLFTFDFFGIDYLKFTSSGGKNAGYNGKGTHFAMDNFTFKKKAKPVPEPATIFGSLTAGAMMLTLYRKYKQQKDVK
ncbi:PEP-CTERM sorting domain-containing protein [Fischerella sp. JS2]|uniref:PEP-CTERM sorting domain-containing protein n=1 Tax=Fischerella sp. JS2 TaxID=2597771 RepID=UPI0028EAF99B|nr:PEP-CTERM sorting domain-containing protein [Fischerella sp. JS2]